MGKTIIIGHQNPDTDSIVSSLVAKDYYQNVRRIKGEAFRAGELNNESKYILKNFKVDAPKKIGKVTEKDEVVLVDHNEKSQTFSGLIFSSVSGIIDHHKLTLETEQPIFCRVEPLGSTASVLAKMYLESGKKIPALTAKLILAGILSDTLNLTSPTTTEYDKKLVKDLNKIAKLSLKEFVEEMFAAKSSLKGISVENIITIDYKNFEMGKSKVGIGTWETTAPGLVNEKKKEIFSALHGRKEKDGLDYIFFMVVDILKQNCYLYLITEKEKELAREVFGGKEENEVMILSGVVSRKKQIVPPLTDKLSK